MAKENHNDYTIAKACGYHTNSYGSGYSSKIDSNYGTILFLDGGAGFGDVLMFSIHHSGGIYEYHKLRFSSNTRYENQQLISFKILEFNIEAAHQ